MMHPQRLALDTCVVSEFAKPRPNQGCLNLLNARPPFEFAMPFPVYAEIQVGINIKRLDGNKNWKAHLRWLNLVMAAGMELLSPTEHTAAIYAKMITTPQLKQFWFINPNSSRVQPEQDLLIAAIAISHNCPLATMNVKDFMLINKFFPLPGLLQPKMGWLVKPTDPVSPIPAVTDPPTFRH
ncbi:type II toxin-antitoxin system VapC family toxin [Phyllobacterium sp. LjRoot231]|uniref:type II toxin-antitoxin system VapC family toxin n=1 Tax=Phyllobacterium sp. LjRoot231 TaxID=3342289 RepID=UPI003ECC6E26